MFSQIPDPLAYAPRFCAAYAKLSEASSSERLAEELLNAVGELSGCELGQLYWLDATRRRLQLVTQRHDGAARACPEEDADFNSEQLLKFCLDQKRSVCIAQSDSDVYDTGFLPASASPWRSLLCQPLAGRDGQVTALLLCATTWDRALDMFAPSLASLGAFAVSQMQLLQRLKPFVNVAVLGSVTPGVAQDYGLIGRSPAMVRVRQLMSKVLHTPHTVLLTGETGTGKEEVSRAIHEHGSRRDKAFVVQNCAALPENLLESELFGYRKGAFTGADDDRPGLFDAANGGTLMLDEIGDMPLSLQAKLLRVLQEGEVRPLGHNVTRKVNVRVIAATHRDLPAMIAEGLFRADLYYRLAQFPIALPALREREGDTIELASHFAREAARLIKRDPLKWSEAALEMLAGYGFPGNVRELKGMVERAVLMCEDEYLRPEDFAIDDLSFTGSDMFNLRGRLDAYERDILLQCLRSVGGNRSLAARKLGVARRTLLYRMAHLDITPVTSRARG
jgi:sigma-54-dependent transcriptional regulator